MRLRAPSAEYWSAKRTSANLPNLSHRPHRSSMPYFTNNFNRLQYNSKLDLFTSTLDRAPLLVGMSESPASRIFFRGVMMCPDKTAVVPRYRESDDTARVPNLPTVCD